METYTCSLFVMFVVLSWHSGPVDSRNLDLAEFKEKVVYGPSMNAFWLSMYGFLEDLTANVTGAGIGTTEIATSDEWISLYRVEIGQPSERIRRKIKAKWQVLDTDNTMILRNTVAWRPDVDICGLVDVKSEPDESDTWGEGGVVLKQVNSTFKRQIRFVSSNASSYFWWVICFNREDIVGGYCPDLIVVLMVPASRLVYDRQADMTGLRLDDIKNDLSTINGTVNFGDERLRYNWLGSECDFNANKMDNETDCTSGTIQHTAANGGIYVLVLLIVCLMNLQRN